MLYVHMLFGLLTGLTTTSLVLAMGASPSAAVGGLVLGCNIGLLLITLGLHIRDPLEDTREPLGAP